MAYHTIACPILKPKNKKRVQRFFLYTLLNREGKQPLSSLLKKVASAAEARRKCPLRVKNEAKKRSLHGVNEHFELNFDDASASAVVFQRAVS
jgi:hypothetical protein